METKTQAISQPAGKLNTAKVAIRDILSAVNLSNAFGLALLMFLLTVGWKMNEKMAQSSEELNGFKALMSERFAVVKADIEEVKAELKADIEGVKADIEGVKTEIKEVNSKLDRLLRQKR